MMDNCLTPGWTELDLGEVRVDRTRSFDPARANDEEFDLYSIPAHDAGTVEHLRGREIGSAKKLLEPGTVIISKINPRISRVGVVGPNRGRRQLGSSEWIAFSPKQGLVPEYLAWYLRQEHVRAYLANNVSGVGGSLMRTNKDAVDRLRFPLAPAEEQVRIVEAIESYLSRLDDAVASLKRAEARLKAYRASVLKAAVEGRLVPTEAALARSAKRDYEPADVLLKRILAGRRRRWEESELAKMIAAGKPPKDEKWKAKYVEPEAPDASTLQELSEGWCWATVEQLADVTGGLTKNAARESLPSRLPYLRVANVYANRLDLSEVKSIGVHRDEICRWLLEPGDLLVVEGNGSVDQIGRVALWDGSISPIVHQNHLIKGRFACGAMARWTLTWLLSANGRAIIESASSSTSGLHTLSISKVKALLVPLPPDGEHQRILDAVDEATSVSDANTSQLRLALQRCAKLRQALLGWAFAGKLVDQDSGDDAQDVLRIGGR